MATPIVHSASYPAPVERVHAAFASEQYWDDRIEQIGGPAGRIDAFTDAEGTVTVQMVQTVAEENLPSLITKIRHGDLEIHRTQIWGPLDSSGQRATGSFSASIPGTPAHISGTVTLAASGTGSTLTVDGEVGVRIPLVGKKVEQIAADQLTRLLNKEDEFTVAWTAAHS
ncbi:MAG: DUF2505 domain-containing protein [Aldersonia sp.]|nr:DUF2505 domain-containing protein [Aldersonia sp.]